MARRKHEGRAVRKEIRIEAPPEAVFDAWAKPEQIAKWFVDGAENEMREGETVKWRFDAFGMDLPIEVYEVEPGKYLAFGGQRPGGPPALQEIILEKDGGATILRLVNSGFLDGEEWDDEFDGVDSGWTMALAALKHWLEKHADAKSSAHVTLMRPAKFEYDELQPRYRTAAGLGWLGEDVAGDPEPLKEGARLNAKVDGALPLDGEVLASTTRELLVSWPEQDAVLGFKAFAAGPAGRMVSLDYRTWDREVADVKGNLERALDRLASEI